MLYLISFIVNVVLLMRLEEVEKAEIANYTLRGRRARKRKGNKLLLKRTYILLTALEILLILASKNIFTIITGMLIIVIIPYIFFARRIWCIKL